MFWDCTRLFPSAQRRGGCAERSEAQTEWREARARFHYGKRFPPRPTPSQAPATVTTLDRWLERRRFYGTGPATRGRIRGEDPLAGFGGRNYVRTKTTDCHADPSVFLCGVGTNAQGDTIRRRAADHGRRRGADRKLGLRRGERPFHECRQEGRNSSSSRRGTNRSNR